jgi:hypothetical protein
MASPDKQFVSDAAAAMTLPAVDVIVCNKLLENKKNNSISFVLFCSHFKIAITVNVLFLFIYITFLSTPSPFIFYHPIAIAINFHFKDLCQYIKTI